MISSRTISWSRRGYATVFLNPGSTRLDAYLKSSVARLARDDIIQLPIPVEDETLVSSSSYLASWTFYVHGYVARIDKSAQ